MHVIVPVIISYLLGSISFSYIVGKLVKGIDVRDHGSGNAGATNTLRVLGIVPAIFVSILDVAKGYGAVWVGIVLGEGEIWVSILCGLAAVIGHNWPIFFGFRGGKGILTTVGMLMALCFLPLLFAGIIAIAMIVITRYVSLGSLIFVMLLPLFIWLMNDAFEILIASLVICLFAFIRHRTNIARLLSGTENKIGAKH